MTEPPRRFPSPCRVIEHAESFWVRDASGQTVGGSTFALIRSRIERTVRIIARRIRKAGHFSLNPRRALSAA